MKTGSSRPPTAVSLALMKHSDNNQLELLIVVLAYYTRVYGNSYLQTNLARGK